MTTDPRDDVAELRSCICVKLADGRPISDMDASDMLDTIEALRQRLEAAEAERDEARAGQAAAWMAGRDAALEEAADVADALEDPAPAIRALKKGAGQ